MKQEKKLIQKWIPFYQKWIRKWKQIKKCLKNIQKKIKIKKKKTVKKPKTNVTKGTNASVQKISMKHYHSTPVQSPSTKP